MRKNWYRIGLVFALTSLTVGVVSLANSTAGAEDVTAAGDCPELIDPILVAAQGDDDLVDEIGEIDDNCDTVAPTVASLAHTGKAGSTVGVCGPETITITLSEPSEDFAAEDVTVSVGALSGWVATSATVYTAVFTPPTNSTGSAIISIAAGAFTDDNENLNVAFTSEAIEFDTQSPTVAVTRSGVGFLGTGQTATITFTLSEPSSDFTSGDVAVSAGALSGWVATSATVYTAVFTPPANSTGISTISIATGSFTDSCNASKQNVNTGELFDFIAIGHDTRVAAESTPVVAPTTATTIPAPPIVLPTRGAAPAKTQVSTRVYFGLRSSVLTAEGKKILKAAVQKLPKNKKFEVVVVGMVQASENVANIEPLSSRRAAAVRTYLRTLGIKGKYEVRVGGVVGETPLARRALATISYS